MKCPFSHAETHVVETRMAEDVDDFKHGVDEIRS